MLILEKPNQIYKKKLPNEVSNRAARKFAKVLLNPVPTFSGRTSALPLILSRYKIRKKNRIDNDRSKKNAVLMAYLDESK